MTGDGPADVDAAAHVYVDALTDRCEIAGADGHHLQRVRRLAPGERVTAADGAGQWRQYEVTAAIAGGLTLAAIGPTRAEPAPLLGVGLAVAPAKGGLEGVVAAVTELGAVRVIPVRTRRTVVRWDAKRAAAAVDRLRSAAREAGMQSRRAWLPVIEPVCDFADVLTRPGLVIADRLGCSASELARPPGPEWTVLVGPEGGLAPEELDALGATPRLRLGPHVLRAATAPVAATAVLVACAVLPRAQ